MVVLDRFPHFSMCFVALQITRWLEITTEGDTAHVWAEDEQYYDAGDHRGRHWSHESSLCQQPLVLVHVGVTLVPGVVGVAHGHLGGGGQGHHRRGLDVLLHVGGEGVGAGPLG